MIENKSSVKRFLEGPNLVDTTINYSIPFFKNIELKKRISTFFSLCLEVPIKSAIRIKKSVAPFL